jgi:two-component system, OmpR family, alkaline phosphatase synthesis response regulator PhoP
MKMKKILIVEDEIDIVELVSYTLKKEGFSVASCLTGTEAIEKVKEIIPDLVVLDLMLPGMDGFEICRQMKFDTTTRNIPIIMLTAKSEESDIVTGLELGADDYVTKPFSPKILVARIRSVLRNKVNQVINKSGAIAIDGLSIIPDKREVKISGELVDLTFSEFQAVYLLASNKGRVFTRYQVVSAIHGDDHIVTDRTIDVLIVGLRKKLNSLADKIETVRGVGYRFKE